MWFVILHHSHCSVRLLWAVKQTWRHYRWGSCDNVLTRNHRILSLRNIGDQSIVTGEWFRLTFALLSLQSNLQATIHDCSVPSTWNAIDDGTEKRWNHKRGIFSCPIRERSRTKPLKQRPWLNFCLRKRRILSLSFSVNSIQHVLISLLRYLLTSSLLPLLYPVSKLPPTHG
jgi:hypothetical protein